MTHLTQLKSSSETNISQLAKAGYTAGDLKTYYQRARMYADEAINKIDKAWDLTIITKQTGLALIAANITNYILNNTNDILATIAFLDTIGAANIRDANHLKLVVASLASRADSIWGESSFMNMLRYRILNQRPFAKQVEDYYSKPVEAAPELSEA